MDQPASTWTVTIDADTAPLRNELVRASALGRQFGSLMTNTFEGIALKGRSLTDVIRSVGSTLSGIVLNAAFRPLGNVFGNALNSALGGGLAFAKGGALQGATPLPFATGGVIATPMTFPMTNGLGLAGERGAEAIMPLSRTADGRLGVAASGTASTVNVTFNVSATDAESFRRSETQIAALLARTIGSGQRNL